MVKWEELHASSEYHACYFPVGKRFGMLLIGCVVKITAWMILVASQHKLRKEVWGKIFERLSNNSWVIYWLERNLSCFQCLLTVWVEKKILNGRYNLR